MCKPDGRILLLEHGRAGWDWLNGILDRGERKHLRKWGCQWNRDIESIVAQVSALGPAHCSLPLGCLWSTSGNVLVFYVAQRLLLLCATMQGAALDVRLGCTSSQAGLEVESISRWHFGTTYIIVARPGRK